MLKTKNEKTVFKIIKEYFKNFGYPEKFGTDNGKEFSNKLLSNYLKENNIKFIQGKAYNPHWQGSVERLQRTIKINLIWEKLDKKKF